MLHKGFCAVRTLLEKRCYSSVLHLAIGLCMTVAATSRHSILLAHSAAYPHKQTRLYGYVQLSSFFVCFVLVFVSVLRWCTSMKLLLVCSFLCNESSPSLAYVRRLTDHPGGKGAPYICSVIGFLQDVLLTTAGGKGASCCGPEAEFVFFNFFAGSCR